MPGLLGTSLTTDEMWDTLKSIGRGINLGSTSGLLGGPVDMATMLLNNPGLLHPGLLGVKGLGIKDPVGGSKWIEQKLQGQGLLPKRQGNWQEGVGELASTFVNPMTAAAVAGPKLYAAEQRAIENAMAPTTLNKQAGAIVWHGSPHKFDKFDSSKIGTGEGKQQQGIGSYLAESQTVGQKYADKEAWKRGMDSGYLYKVDVPDSMLSSMAAHDLPLSAQSEKVRKAVGQMLDSDSIDALRKYHGWENPNDAPFSAVMDALEIAKGNNRAGTSEALRQAGIPGIRYLDGGSRGAGSGTSNFVVFPGNEDLLRILERNGQPIGLLGR